jgi:Flp pilus assembly protein TadG
MQRKSNSGRLMMLGSEGSIAVVVAIAMVVLLGIGSLAIDIGQIVTVRSELQNTADAASMAAARALIVEYTDPLHPDYAKDVIRDGTAAYNAAIAMIQAAATNQGRTWDANGYQISVIFSYYNDHALTSKWNPLLDANGIPFAPAAVPSDSNANAVQVTVTRAASKSYGPVTNFFAGVFGMGATEVSASAQAYMGYAASTYPGTVQVPVALPSTGGDSPLASRGKSGWWGRMFGPDEAVASAPTTKTIVFRDSAGYYVPGSTTPVPLNVQTYNPTVTGAFDFSHGDPTQIYLYTVGSGDSMPYTLWSIISGIYGTPYGNGSYPTHVGKLALGQQIYPASEYCWGNTWLPPIFKYLKAAYYYKTTGDSTTAPPAGTPWRVTFAVYGTKANPLIKSQIRECYRYLARLLAPWATEAFACATISAPKMYVNGFVNADIVGVTCPLDKNGNPTSDDGSSYKTWPQTITTYPPIPSTGSTTYTNKLDFLARYSNSVWNANTMTITNVTSVSTIIPGTATAHASYNNTGGEGGGLSAQEMNSAASTNVGAFASIPKLIH